MSRRKAEQFETAWRSSLLFGGYGLEEKKQISFEDFLVQFFLPYSEANKKSFERDVVICKAALPFFKGRNLRDITPAEVEKFKALRMNTKTIHQTPRQSATVARELSVVSKIFSMALNNDFIDSNPMKKVEKLQFDNSCMRVLHEDGDEKFLAAFESEWARDICALILNTALRQNDAVGLRLFRH